MAVQQIFVKRFFTKFKHNPVDAGQLVGTDYVEYGPLGSLDRTMNTDSVRNVLDRLQPLEDSQNPAVILAHERASVIRKAYEAWKVGREAPVNGTPLAAWNAVNAEQVDAMIRVGIKSVEDVAGLTDASSSRLGLPNRNELIRQAKNFLEAKEQTRLAAKLTERDGVIDALSAENEENKTLLRELSAKLAELSAAKSEPAAEDEEEAPARRRAGKR